jgi:hypothetical protein
MYYMPCLIAYTLFQDYAKATIDYFEATDNLAMLVGQHDNFAEAKKHTDRTHTKCRAARPSPRAALERTWLSGPATQHRIPAKHLVHALRPQSRPF